MHVAWPSRRRPHTAGGHASPRSGWSTRKTGSSTWDSPTRAGSRHDATRRVLLRPARPSRFGTGLPPYACRAADSRACLACPPAVRVHRARNSRRVRKSAVVASAFRRTVVRFALAPRLRRTRQAGMRVRAPVGRRGKPVPPPGIRRPAQGRDTTLRVVRCSNLRGRHASEPVCLLTRVAPPTVAHASHARPPCAATARWSWASDDMSSPVRLT